MTVNPPPPPPPFQSQMLGYISTEPYGSVMIEMCSNCGARRGVPWKEPEMTATTEPTPVTVQLFGGQFDGQTETVTDPAFLVRGAILTVTDPDRSKITDYQLEVADSNPTTDAVWVGLAPGWVLRRYGARAAVTDAEMRTSAKAAQSTIGRARYKLIDSCLRTADGVTDAGGHVVEGTMFEFQVPDPLASATHYLAQLVAALPAGADTQVHRHRAIDSADTEGLVLRTQRAEQRRLNTERWVNCDRYGSPVTVSAP